MIPAAAVRQVGLPCKEFFILFDDADYSIRLRRDGFDLVAVRRSIGRRMLPQPSAGRDWKAAFAARNRIWLNRMHRPNRLARALWPCLLRA